MPRACEGEFAMKWCLLLGAMTISGCCNRGSEAVEPDRLGSKQGGKPASTTPEGQIPEIPDGTSNPPSVAEWQSGHVVNTVGANSAPSGCQMKIVREWLKVNCSGKIKEVTNMEGFGRKGFDYFDSVVPGKYADLVVRLRKGGSIKARILRDGPHSASLFVNWPGGNPRPSIVALQIFNG